VILQSFPEGGGTSLLDNIAMLPLAGVETKMPGAGKKSHVC
jgi:hypothetical protein